MKTPFTSNQFFEVLKNYNENVFPWQVLFFVLGVFTAFLAIRPNSKSNKMVALILSFFWMWMGIAYHLIFFTTINKAAYLFGIIFIVQGIMFLFKGAFKNELSFEFHPDRYGIAGIILIVYALLVYPVSGYLLGHAYPSSPTFGLPCPTTIFTFGVLLLSNKKIPPYIMIIPVVWSIIGFSAAFQFGIIEDTGLIIAALYTFPVLLLRNRKITET